MNAGGLNLLYPGNQIGDDEAQELLNFSVDSFGSLRSRKGHTVRYTLGAGAVNMLRALGALMIASGGNVYKDGGALIAGLSSNAVGLAGFKDFIWAMSAADQRKSDGTSDWNWIPDPPSTKPTIKPTAAVETVIVDFTSGFTVDPTGDETYSPGLQINAPAEKEYTAVKDSALDLYTGYSLDDVFRISVWCKQWKKINGVTFQIDCGDGTFTDNFYTAEMKQVDIAAGKKEEVVFYLRKRPLGVDQAAVDKKRYGHFDRVGSAPDKDYRSCVKVRVKVDFSDSTKIRFNEWILVGDASNTLEGDDFQGYYTYTTDAGHESNPSPVSDPITLNRTGVAVSAMAISADPQVTGQNFYLTGGTLEHVYRTNGTTVIVGATHTVTQSDDDLSGDDLQLEIDHDAPPAVRGLIGPYFDRLIAFGGNKVYWTHTSKPYAFAGAALLDGDWLGVEESVGELLAATMRTGMLWLYGTNGVVVLQGDPGGASAAHRSAAQMGIQSAQSVAQSPRGDFAIMSEGVYLFTGDSGELLSKKIDSVFKGGFVFGNGAIGYRNEIVWVSDGVVTYRFDLATGRWFQDSRIFCCFYNDNGTLVGSTPTGAIVDLESGFTDAGSAIDVAYKSKAYDAGLLDNEKRWEDFTCWADTAGANLTVTAYLNDGQDDEFTVALGTLNSVTKERFVLQFNALGEGVDARTCAIRITGSVSSEAVISERTLNYYPKAREGKSFDTGEIDLGTHKMKRLRQLVLDIDNPAASTVTIKSDRPQPMATRTTLAVAPTTDRRMQPLVLTDTVIGRLFRIVPHSTDQRVYGGRVLYQVFGTYLEEGEYYQSDPLDFGSERIKLIREIEVVYEGVGGHFTLKTDLPGNEITTRGQTDFPAVVGEQSIKVRLEADIKGRLYEALFEPVGATRIEAIRFLIKMVGMPNATPWTWVDLPIASTQDAIWSEISFGSDDLG